MGRFGFLQELLWELWEDLPDLGLVPVLYRLLDYYATMARRRREVDRLLKSGRPIQFNEAVYEPPEQRNRFQDIAAEIREIRGIACGCQRREWWAELKGEHASQIRILHHCLACAVQIETIVTGKEFAARGQAIG
jgi:hypothetical protein